MKTVWSQSRWSALIPLIAVIILFVAEAVARNGFFTCKSVPCQSIPGHIWSVIQPVGTAAGTAAADPGTTIANLDLRRLAALQYGGRMGWLTLAKIDLFVCLASFVIAVILTFRQFPRRPWLWVLGMLLASTAVGLLLYFNPGAHMAVFLALFEKTVATDLPLITLATDFLNSLGNAATFALLLTICALLAPVTLEPYPAGMKQLSQKMKSLRVILFTGALMLVVNMMLKSATFQWTLAYTSQEAKALDISNSLVASFLNMDGTFYTLVLAAAYLPASLILKQRARLLANLPVDESEVEKKLEESGLTFAYLKSLPRALAIFAPFLAGPLGELINSILSSKP